MLDFDFSWVSTPEAWIALATLTLLEIVLGIDNIVFISILSNKLPESQRKRARTVGLAVALISRLLLLFSISWVIGLTDPLFTLPIIDHVVSGRDLVLLIGGLFLVAKSTHEIHNKLDGDQDVSGPGAKVVSFASVIIQIAILDIVFSLDSVITAVGMADHLMVMVIAVVIAVVIMLLSVNVISDFVHKHPTVKMLALAFLLMIGVMLFAEGFGAHIPKGYIYFAMAFSVVVEFLNLRAKKVRPPVELREPKLPANA